nr:unnamed protein product [Callosobruchus analis]
MANQPSFIKDFIDIYRKHNCLWQVKSPEYANKQLRSVAYDELLQLFKTVSDDATIEAVKNKINNMRSAFRKELKKVKESKRSGTSSEQVYIPTLWYYDSLLFTIQHEQYREAISSCRDFQEEEENETQVENESDHELRNIENTNISSPQTPSSIIPSRTPTPNLRKAAKRPKKDLMLEKAHEILNRSTPDTEFKTIGANVAWKLERMAEDQRIIAEHLINNILHYGITKKLNDNTSINLHAQTAAPTLHTTNLLDKNFMHSTQQNTQFNHTQLYSQTQPQSQMTTYIPPESLKHKHNYIINN